MKKSNPQGLILMLSIILTLVGSFAANANIVVAPATGGNCLQLAPAGAYTVLSNISITESNVNDFAIQGGTTFILSAPAGFEFKPGVGSMSFNSGNDISSLSLLVTTTSLTVTMNVATATKLDFFRIRFVEVRAITPNTTGQILRTIAGGTATIAGNNPGGGINHGSLYASGSGGSFTTASNGIWSSPATWIGGVVPNCTDNVTINHLVNGDVVVGLNNLIINSGGNLISDQAITVSGAFSMTGTAIYTHNNISNAAVTIFSGAESFSATSTLVIDKWSSFTTPLPNGVTGNFGNLTFNTTGSWSQNGLFAPNRIKGTLAITNGSIIMDNGTGMSTSLTLQDVAISGSGCLVVQSGTPRNLTLITGNFTDVSTSTNYTYMMYRSVGNFDWTVNGNLNVSHRFTAIEGTSAANVGSAVIHVTGDFTIGGGLFTGLKQITGSINMTVDGASLITGGPSLVAFKDYYIGDVTFNSGSLAIDNSRNTYFLGTHSTVGAVTINITGDFSISGASTRVYYAVNDASFNDIFVTIGNDLILTDALLSATNGGIVNYSIGRNYTQTGATSNFRGQYSSVNAGNVDMTINGSMTINGGLFTQSRTTGSVSLNVTEVIDVQNATFYGMNNTTLGNNGIGTLSCTDLSISASTFDFYRGVVLDGRTIPINISNQLSINFTNAAQRVYFISRAGDNNAVLDLNIGTNFYVTGTADGLFCSSMSTGMEDISIGNDFSVSGGRARFNAFENASARGHTTTGSVGGSVLLSGGSIAFSSHVGTTNWTITGDFDQTGGYSVCKWHTGTTNINILGNFSLVNGLSVLYARTKTIMPNPVTITINGNATFDNSVVMFDSCLTSTATHNLIFKGNKVNYNDNVVFDHKAHLSTRLVFGSIQYDKAGTITTRRNGPVFDIRQVKQIITAGTIVDFSASPYDLMIASHSSSIATTHTALNINGTLNMGEKMIVGRSEPNYYSSINVNSGARLITAHANGLYSGTAAASCIYPLVNTSYRMNFFLHSASTVEYNGIDNQIVSGTGIGIATTTNHRYGNLDINFQGTADVEFAHPATDSVQVRTALILTGGELNLDDDHTTNTGGYTLQLLNGAIITRNSGYIRSEVEDGTGAVKWNITTNGSFVVPFGYNSTEFIPFTYQPVAGSSGDVVLATYHSAADNTPYPPTVSHVRDLTGADNSVNTVDRYWRIEVSGGATSNLTFSFTNAERSGIVNPRAQLWEPVSLGWFPPTGVQSNPTANTTLASTLTALNTWWTLSSALTPLPVELLSFNAIAESKIVRLDWTTASEINNDFFTVERSADGETFNVVTEVDGAGTSSIVHDYRAYDKTPLYGINYYRIKQTDFDGNATWSEVKKIKFVSNSTVSVYPNPIIGNVISIISKDDQEVVSLVSLYDLAGKLILKMDQDNLGSDNGVAQLEIGNYLADGAYLLEVNTNNGVYREKIIKQ